MIAGGPVGATLVGAAGAGVAARGAAGEAAAGAASPDGAAGAVSTMRRESTVCATPSSRTVKSAAVRSRTRFPFLSRTTTSTTTAAVWVPKTGGGDAGPGACAQADAGRNGPGPAARADIRMAARDLVSLRWRMAGSILAIVRRSAGRRGDAHRSFALTIELVEAQELLALARGRFRPSRPLVGPGEGEMDDGALRGQRRRALELRDGLVRPFQVEQG